MIAMAGGQAAVVASWLAIRWLRRPSAGELYRIQRTLQPVDPAPEDADDFVPDELVEEIQEEVVLEERDLDAEKLITHYSVTCRACPSRRRATCEGAELPTRRPECPRCRGELAFKAEFYELRHPSRRRRAKP